MTPTRSSSVNDVTGRVVARVEVLETPTAVHFLLVSALNPKRPETELGWGTGYSATATAELSQPLNHRTVCNDFRIPAQPVDVHPA